MEAYDENILERVREKQARYAVVMEHQPLADRSGMKRNSVSCIAAGIHPLTTERLVQFTHIQGDYGMFREISEMVGGLFIPPTKPITAFQLTDFSQVVGAFGDFLSIAAKVVYGSKLN